MEIIGYTSIKIAFQCNRYDVALVFTILAGRLARDIFPSTEFRARHGLSLSNDHVVVAAIPRK